MKKTKQPAPQKKAKYVIKIPRKMITKSNLSAMIDDRLNQLKAIRIEKKLELEDAPDGMIHVVKSRNRVQYYHRTSPEEKSGSYIPCKEKKKIATLLQKSYNERLLKQIDREIAVLERFCKRYAGCQERIKDIFSLQPLQVKAQLKPVDMSDEDFAEAWDKIPYTPKEMENMTSELFTEKGEQVRSKSELNIANALCSAGIPYKYECPFRLNNDFVIYPDFTVLNVRNRKTIFWEHRGMMDDREYAIHSVSRVKDYAKSGIILGDRLIVTEEIGNKPLGTREIERIINCYFSDER